MPPSSGLPFRAAVLLASASVLPLPTCGSNQPGTYAVELKPQQHSLYTDPYNGNRILLGGFSGMYPVPGRGDRLYVITDRGPAPDFVDACGEAYKTWAVPEFGPHLITLDLQPHARVNVRDVKPLTRPDGSPITGLPTTVPFTDLPYDFHPEQLPFDEDSLDAEGLCMDAAGNFWVGDEVACAKEDARCRNGCSSRSASMGWVKPRSRSR